MGVSTRGRRGSLVSPNKTSADRSRRPSQCRDARRSCVRTRLIFDVLYKTLGAGVQKFSLRDVPAAIVINLREVDDDGAAANLANKSPNGTALFQIASHCSGFRAAEGRPDVMVFACASTQLAVNGSMTKEMMDGLNICLLLVLGGFILQHHDDGVGRRGCE